MRARRGGISELPLGGGYPLGEHTLVGGRVRGAGGPSLIWSIGVAQQMSRKLHLTLSVGLLSMFSACASCPPPPPPPDRPGVLYTPADQPFAISLVPAVPVPIRIGTNLGFNVSSSTAGYYSLYLINPAAEVWVLAENLPLGAGSVTYPSPPAQNFTLTAAEPLGANRVILLVTRDPISGFSGNNTLSSAVSLAIRGNTFVSQLNGAIRALPPSDWAIDEIAVSIVA